MGRLDDRLMNHAAHKQLEDARAALNSLSEEARQQADSTAPEGAWSRATDALDYVDGLLSAADPALVWQGLLDSILNQLSQVQSYASQLISQPQQVGPLDQAIDGLVGLAAQLASTVRITKSRAKRIDAALGRGLAGTARDLRNDLEALQQTAETLEQRQHDAAAQAMAVHDQREGEIAARLDELRSAVSTEKQRLDSLVPSFEQQFTASQAARDQAHQDAIARFDDEAGELVQRVNDDADKLMDGLRESVNTLLTESSEAVREVLEAVRARRDEVDQLYGVITNTGTASAFRDDAEQQRRSANAWRWIAVFFAVLAAAATGWAAITASDDSTKSLIARLALGVAAGGIAAYAANQSGRHRRREEDARRLELELTAFGPFIDSLPEEAQRDARREFLDRIFVGRPDVAQGATLTEESIGLMRNVVDVVLRAGRVRQPPA